MELLQLLLITTLITNVIVLIILFAIYQSQATFFDIAPLVRKVAKLRNHLAKKEEKVLEKALEESKSSVNETLQELKGIEGLVEGTRAKLEAEANKLVQDNISKNSEIFQKVTKDINNSYERELEGLSNIQQAHYLKLLEEAKGSIAEEIKKLREQVGLAATEERNKVEEEMRLYKENLKSDLNSRIFLIISEVAEQTIGASIDTAKHEELVMKALEKAKEEKFF